MVKTTYLKPVHRTLLFCSLNVLKIFLKTFRLTKTLDYEGDELVLAKDANMKTADWYALDDPRNPVVQRRREEAKRAAKKGMNSRRDLI